MHVQWAGMRSGAARRELVRGVKDISPVLLGITPFGLVTGVTAVSVGLPDLEAIFMSAIVFAGAAQLAGLQLLQQGAPAVIIILTTFVINARFMMYSAALAPHFRHFSRPWKLLSAYLTTDQSFAFGMRRFISEPLEPNRRWYYLGASGICWLAWMAASALGVGLGRQLPRAWSLDFAIPLIFLAILVPILRGRGSLLAAVTGGGVAVLAVSLPMNLGLLLGALCGIVAGALAERPGRSL